MAASVTITTAVPAVPAPIPGWIEVTVWADAQPSTYKVLIQIVNICRIGRIVSHGYIKQVDGGSAETAESYSQLRELILQKEPQ